MKRKIELLAPGGDIDSIKAAILAGADAIYCGLDKFNARNRAVNINIEELKGILYLAHKNHCKIFLTLNIIIIENEINALLKLLNKLVNTSIDGIIVQDLGMLYILSKYFKYLNIHASTQLTTHNEGQIKFLDKIGVTRVNLSRELNIKEIQHLSIVGARSDIKTEVFVHGSNCISFSGICYFSSIHSGNSGNRGRCSQPCRDKYITTPMGKDYPLNLKDNSAFFLLQELYDAGVSSVKIEGRIKKFDYVYTVVDLWRKQIDNLYSDTPLSNDNSVLYKVFNRDFSSAYLKGDINKEMFIDNSRGHSVQHLLEINNYSAKAEKEKDEIALYEEKDEIRTYVKKRIEQLSIAQIPLDINVYGKEDEKLKIEVKTPENSFVLFSEVFLAKVGLEMLDKEMILKRFKSLNDTAYYIEHLNLENLPKGLFIAFKELTTLKKKLLFILNDSREVIPSVNIPKITSTTEKEKPTLSVLIDSPKDISLCDKVLAKVYFQLPNCFKNKYISLIKLFKENKELIPWFPSVLIGEYYQASISFLEEIKPKSIVTNNTGIAYEAYKRGISWIAGPFLNVVNSYSLLYLKEHFNCKGSFLSNEINKRQIKAIKKPDNFDLYYSIYHPIVLITSRQCLFHQVVGCEKDRFDDVCLEECDRSASITNLKEQSFFLEKKQGNYHCLYNDSNFLNIDIVNDIPDLFSSYFIDLREVRTETKINIDKVDMLNIFQNFINGDFSLKEKIKSNIFPTNNLQYIKGI